MAMPADDPPPGVPEWVVTYGDMMSLLLTFFIMLVSMSELKSEGKLRMMMDAMNQQFGPTTWFAGAPGRSLQTNSAFGKLGSRGSSSEGGLEKGGLDSPGTAGLHRPGRRLGHQDVPALGGPVYFGRFDATLTAEAAADLDRLVAAFSAGTEPIAVRGHATPEPPPVDGPYADAWDLSFARAKAVAEHLVSRGIDRDRLAVSAAGDTEPRARGGAAAQAANRRVDVFLTETYRTPPAAP